MGSRSIVGPESFMGPGSPRSPAEPSVLSRTHPTAEEHPQARVLSGAGCGGVWREDSGCLEAQDKIFAKIPRK